MNDRRTRRSAILHGSILIVDDREGNVQLLARMLAAAGYDRVTSTSNPLEVCDLHFRNRYDLILLDLQMPAMDGFEVMEGLKDVETDGYLPILVITAQPEHKLRALKAGARDFVSKPFDLPEVLARVHNLLEVRLLHLETKRLYQQVVLERHASEQLLLNVLPASIAERHGLEKIKTIGDCYMVAAGVPVPVADHTERAAKMALDMVEALHQFSAEHTYPLEVRIGIDTGAAVAGVIGRSKFLYDLWGDVVNTASRMESHGVPGRIQVTEAAWRRLQGDFVLEGRGIIDVKGKGPMNTWFLNGRKGSQDL